MNAARVSGGAPRFFAAGAAHVDRRGRSSGPFIPGASNPGTLREAPGGAVFNAVRALRHLGAEVTLVSARGGDRDGLVVGEALEAMGVTDLGLTWLDRHTPTYTAILDGNGDLVGGLADMALYDLMQPRVFRRRHWHDALDGCDTVLLDANLPAASIADLARAAAGRPVSAIGVSPAKAVRLRPALPLLAAVFLSKPEAQSLAGLPSETSILATIEALAEIGCRRAVITQGADATAIWDDGQLSWQHPLPLDRIRDVTGAGDTLAAVASFAFVSGLAFNDAVRHGMAAASLHISGERDAEGADWGEIASHAARMPNPTDNPPA